MEERGLRLARTDGAFFSKITTTLNKILIPTKVGINGMLISMKRNNVVKTYFEYKSDSVKSKENIDTLEKKYENAVVLYLESLDKYIMESIYKKVKNRTATTFEEAALSRYYNVTHLKETQYLEYKYKKQQFLMELDYEGLKSSGKDKVLEKYKTFYADKMNGLYKGLLKNYSVKLADRVNQNPSDKDKIYDDIFENLEKYIANVLPIKIEEGTEPAYKEIVNEYDKFNSFLAGKLDKRDIIEKRMLLLGISRKLFTHSLPLVVAEQCYERLLRDTRLLIVKSPNKRKQEMAYDMLITLTEDYNVKLLSTKIYWEKPKDRDEYRKFWDEYQDIENFEGLESEKNRKKEILFLKNELKKFSKRTTQVQQLIKFYKKKLVEFGVVRVMKNSCTTGSKIKLTKKK